MGIMITDPEIVESLTHLSAQLGITKSAVLKRLVSELAAELNVGDEDVFPRDRVEYRTYRI